MRQLEKDWESALTDQERLIEEHDRFTVTCPAVLTPAEQSAVMALASDIPGLWTAPTTTDADRKEIIRAVLNDVTLTVIGDTERVSITVTWAGGHTTSGELIRPVARLVGSDRGALSGSRPVGFPGPPAAPAVRLSP